MKILRENGVGEGSQTRNGPNPALRDRLWKAPAGTAYGNRKTNPVLALMSLAAGMGVVPPYVALLMVETDV
jgi:hypothetical protein